MTRNEAIAADLLAYVIRQNASPEEKARLDRADKARRIMARAWDIARLASETFGGARRDYIAGALSQAWAEARGECDSLNADATLFRIQARKRKEAGTVTHQRTGGYRGRDYYAAAVGW